MEFKLFFFNQYFYCFAHQLCTEIVYVNLATVNNMDTLLYFIFRKTIYVPPECLIYACICFLNDQNEAFIKVSVF